MSAAEQLHYDTAPEETTAGTTGPVDVEALKDAVKRVVVANRKIGGREEKIAAKRQRIEELDALVRKAEDREEMNEAMKKLNRAHAALDRIINTGHNNAIELDAALRHLAETASAARTALD